MAVQARASLQTTRDLTLAEELRGVQHRHFSIEWSYSRLPHHYALQHVSWALALRSVLPILQPDRRLPIFPLDADFPAVLARLASDGSVRHQEATYSCSFYWGGDCLLRTQGKVQLDPAGPGYQGALGCSSKTSELEGLLSMLLWLQEHTIWRTGAA